MTTIDMNQYYYEPYFNGICYQNTQNSYVTIGTHYYSYTTNLKPLPDIHNIIINDLIEPHPHIIDTISAVVYPNKITISYPSLLIILTDTELEIIKNHKHNYIIPFTEYTKERLLEIIPN